MRRFWLPCERRLRLSIVLRGFSKEKSTHNLNKFYLEIKSLLVILTYVDKKIERLFELTHVSNCLLYELNFDIKF